MSGGVRGCEWVVRPGLLPSPLRPATHGVMSAPTSESRIQFEVPSGNTYVVSRVVLRSDMIMPSRENITAVLEAAPGVAANEESRQI